MMRRESYKVGLPPGPEEIAVAETPKKAKAPSKPKTTATRAKAAPKSKAATAPAYEEIAVLAHRFWIERGGGHHGDPNQDWLRAEELLRGKAS
jgi:hypothetical protein